MPALGKGTIAILTGGGDVPGLNPAIRAITIRALRDGYRVVGIRHGWGGLVDYVPQADADNSDNVFELSEAIVNRAGRTGGTFLHTSRVRPSHLPQGRVPPHLTGYEQPVNDITKDVLKNLEHIGVDVLIPIGGDDTLSYAKRLHDEGVHVVAIPKTMDNDVYGTDYCIGFSTCVTRTIELTHRLRTSAGSHERFLVIEVFGRYAGFTALLVTHDVEEALLLATRVLVLSERPATIKAELLIDRPYPRHRGDVRLVELRRQVLGLLGLAATW